MKIYTSFFGNMRNIPRDVAPVSIALKMPSGWEYSCYPRLAPKGSIL